MNTSAPVIVYGETSASVFLIHELLKQNETIIWIAGSGTRLLPVMPYVKSESALSVLVNAQNSLDETPHARALEKATFHRVFRNKAFKVPSWKRATSLETQKESFAELVWDPEQSFLGVEEFRIGGLTPMQIENELRTRFETEPQIQKIENNPIVEFEVFEHGGKIQFAKGSLIEFKQFFFCDSLKELRSFPKLAAIFKRSLSGLNASKSMNALQVVFHHASAMNQPTDVGLVIPMNRDAGDTFDRDVLGYFLDDRTSVWTVFLQPSECEENHEIMKKLRKMKQALNRAFEGPEFLPEGKKDFLSTVDKEQFRFEENCLMTEGELKPSKANIDFVLLPDTFGITRGLEAIAERFEFPAIEFSPLESDVASVDYTVGPETETAPPNP